MNMTHREISKNEIEISISGDIQIETVENLRNFLLESVKSHHQIVSINFSNAIIHCFTKLLGFLLIIRKRLADEKKILKIRGCGDDFYQKCQLVMLTRIIPIEK